MLLSGLPLFKSKQTVLSDQKMSQAFSTFQIQVYIEGLTFIFTKNSIGLYMKALSINYKPVCNKFKVLFNFGKNYFCKKFLIHAYGPQLFMVYFLENLKFEQCNYFDVKKIKILNKKTKRKFFCN